jgi:hypothetical protein
MNATVAAQAPGNARLPARSRFFPAMAALLLLLVVLGFSQTFYLRAFFEVRPIAWNVWLHGFALTAWFVGLVLQAVLVSSRRLDLHRRIGWGFAALAIVVAATGVWITLGTVSALAATGFSADAIQTLAPRVAWGNYAAAFTFALLVGAAVVWRRNAQTHKRLMLLASIAIMSPALARLLQWPVFGSALNANFAVAAMAMVFVLALVVVAHDVVARKRLYAATVIGVSLIVGLRLFALIVVAPSALGRALVPGLSP